MNFKEFVHKHIWALNPQWKYTAMDSSGLWCVFGCKPKVLSTSWAVPNGVPYEIIDNQACKLLNVTSHGSRDLYNDDHSWKSSMINLDKIRYKNRKIKGKGNRYKALELEIE